VNALCMTRFVAQSEILFQEVIILLHVNEIFNIVHRLRLKFTTFRRLDVPPSSGVLGKDKKPH
jgi:hypothetical protein